MTQEVYRKRHGDALLIVEQTEGSYWPFVFSIEWKGQTWSFPTVPNRCLTRHQAIMRGFIRCQWLNQGTFFTRYR